MKTNLLETDPRSVRKSFRKSEKDVQDYISIIKSWFKLQKHLPEIPCDEIIESFLVTNKFSVERTKEKLDMYYTIRSLLPELCRNKNPKLPHMKQIAQVVWFCPLPKLTKELYRVNVTKILGDPGDFNTYNYFGHQLNINEIRLHEETNLGDLLIVDFKEVKRGHVVKFTPVHMKKAALILEKVFSSRIKGVHIINAPQYVDTVVMIVKSVMKQKLADRVHVHNSPEALLDYIPKEILPRDYGGEEMSLEELQGLWLRKLEEYQERFDKLDSLEVREDLRPIPLKNDDILGYHGNFKKLDVD